MEMMLLSELRQKLVLPHEKTPISAQAMRYWLTKLKIKTKRKEHNGYSRSAVAWDDAQVVLAAFRRANNVAA